MSWRRPGLLLLAGLVIPTLSVGCNPFSMGFGTPIPVQPWVADQIEQRLKYQNDHKTAVLPPIPAGHRPLCEDPPDRAEILRVMPRVTRGVPYVYEEFRDDLEFSVRKLVDRVDPPRFYPLIGPAQLHHCHWECTVYYTETVESSYPFPFQVKRRRAQVVYIDKDHLHVYVENPDARQVIIRDMTAVRP